MLFLLFNFFVFIFGLVVGSFLNCLIYRLSLDDFSFWKTMVKTGRSYCPHCKKNIPWQDLIPVFSFLFLKGECRHCHKKISWQYPIVEILTGLLFLLISNILSPSFTIYYLLFTIFYFYIASSFMVIFVYDLKHYIIPDVILFPAIGVAVLYKLLNPQFFIFNSLPAAIGVFLFFWSLYLISKGKWMGFGDCKLVILLGLLLGFPGILLAMFLSFFFGAIIGVALIVFAKQGLKSQVPFAPFLITGTFVTLLFGEQILNWYAQFFSF